MANGSSSDSGSGNAQPDLDAIIEAFAYLETESRRLTKGLAEQYGLTGPQLVVVTLLEPSGRLSLSELS